MSISTMNHDYFKQLKEEIDSYESLSSKGGYLGYFGQEALRFHSIAGTLLEGFDFRLDETANNSERHLTHVLIRSLLENFFWIMYLFYDPTKSMERYEELTNSFKRDYVKLMGEDFLPQKDKLEPADPSWSKLKKGLDVKSMLTQVKNDYGDNLSYLYFTYRVTSFDTHGKNLGVILEDVFGQTSNFPVIKIGFAINCIANQYLCILQDLRSKGVIG